MSPKPFSHRAVSPAIARLFVIFGCLSVSEVGQVVWGGREDIRRRRGVQAELQSTVHMSGRRLRMRDALSPGTAASVDSALSTGAAGGRRGAVLPWVGLSTHVQSTGTRRRTLHPTRFTSSIGRQGSIIRILSISIFADFHRVIGRAGLRYRGAVSTWQYRCPPRGWSLGRGAVAPPSSGAMPPENLSKIKLKIAYLSAFLEAEKSYYSWNNFSHWVRRNTETTPCSQPPTRFVYWAFEQSGNALFGASLLKFVLCKFAWCPIAAWCPKRALKN